MELSLPILIFGLLLCLFGWTLYWAGLRILGGVLGAGTGWVLGLLLVEWFGISEQYNLLSSLIGAAAGILVGVFLFKMFHYYMIFLVGATVGTLLVHRIILMLEGPIAENQIYAWLAHLVGATATGFLFIFCQKSLIILFSSLTGSVLVLIAVPSAWMIYLFIPILVTSLLVQSRILNRVIQRQKLRESLEKAAAEAGQEAEKGKDD